MFVKKLVEKASYKKSTANVNGIKPSELNPHLVFHYGIPSGSVSLAYDSVQKILAISTKDGRIKLLGLDNTQALLESIEPAPSKFMQFLENQVILLKVTVQNHIEVWDIVKKQLCFVYMAKEEITSFTVIQQTSFVYVGDSVGNISVFKVDPVTYNLVQMNYNIPLSASHGNTTEVADDTAVMFIMPQPMAESKRVVIIFRDGLIVLWGVEESKVYTVMGGNLLSLSNDTKKVTSACWVCPFGGKVVVGYNNGEIYIWSVPTISHPSTPEIDRELSSNQNTLICKLNLGYKMDQIPILSLKWVYGEGKTSHLYVNGISNSSPINMFQVVLLNEQMASRTIKLALPLPEPCTTMEIISSMTDQNKKKHISLLVLLKSGHLCTYDVSVIEKLLLQSNSRSELPKELMVKLPYADSSITVAKFFTNDSNFLNGLYEDHNMLVKNFPVLLPIENKEKDGSFFSSTHFSGFTKIKNLYITGHSDGTISFWDASSPLLFPISSVKQQNEDDRSASGIPLSALYFDIISRILVSGDHSGMVRIFKLKPEPFSTENNIFSLPGSSKKGRNNIIQSVKCIKVDGVVLSININQRSQNFAIGTDKGNVYLIDIEGPTILFENNITSELCNSIISLQFETCSVHGFEKNVLLVGTKDSSVVALETDTGSTLSAASVHPTKPAKALFMQIVDIFDCPDANRVNSVEEVSRNQPLLLCCNEKAVYIYSLVHAVQGIKKVLYKKKFHGTCCWASTFYNHDSGVALVLLFPGGNFEIRSVPELSLLKEFPIRGFTFHTPKPNSFSDTSLCASSDGEIILVNGDQEVFFVSLLVHNEIYRFLSPIGHVYKGMIALPEESTYAPVIHKEKKKGIFSSVMKDKKSNKAKQDSEMEVENSSLSIADELTNIFSVANFDLDKENTENLVEDKEDEVELNIDDIDFEDEKPKGQNIITANKQKLANTFLSIKGKLKQKMNKNEKSPTKAEIEDEKVDTIDQIKKKYGFAPSADASAAKMAENKLRDNIHKLQGISLRTTEMQGTAQSFSTIAKEVLRTAEKDKRTL